MRKPYFKKHEGDPDPITATAKRHVRFSEIDMLGIAWHGHYAGFFEDARITLGQRYAIGYMDLYANGILAPIKSIHVDFIQPLKFLEEITIEAVLHYSVASRINCEYIVRNGEGTICATGYTVQMMLNKDHELFLTQPDYFRDFCDKWKAGTLT